MPSYYQKHYTNERTLIVLGEKIAILKQPTENLINAPPLQTQSLTNVKKVRVPTAKPPPAPSQQSVPLKTISFDKPVSIYADRFRKIEEAQKVEDFLRLLLRGRVNGSAHGQTLREGRKASGTTSVRDVDDIIDANRIYFERFETHFDRLKNIRT